MLYLTKFNRIINPIKPIFVSLKENLNLIFDMTTFYNKYALKTFYTFLAIAAISFLPACKGGDTPTVNVGTISVFNASPTLATYDVYLNDLKFNTVALPLGGGVKYTQITPNTYTAKFTVAGSSDAVYTKSGLSISNNSFSTLYLVGTPGNFDGLFIADNFGTPAADKAYVRFINLSPDAPALDLAVKDATSSLVTNKAYKQHGEFTATAPEATVFTLKETSSGTVKTTLESATLKAGFFYTIIARGKITPANGSERAFSGQVILHQ